MSRKIEKGFECRVTKNQMQSGCKKKVCLDFFILSVLFFPYFPFPVSLAVSSLRLIHHSN
jgi:hypothetical protein